MGLKRAAIAVTALLAIAACGPAPRTPTDVVALYFTSLGRDPMRTLPITTEAFHRAHALGLAGGAAPDRVDRAQVAWLAIQNRDQFARIASELVVTPRDVQESGDAATVTVAVARASSAPFLQTFHLLRDGPGSAWRIDAVEQEGVAAGDAAVAFVAHPTEAARRAIERRTRAPLQPRGTLR